MDKKASPPLHPPPPTAVPLTLRRPVVPGEQPRNHRREALARQQASQQQSDL